MRQKVAAAKSQVSDSEENRNKNRAANVKVSLTLRNSGSESNYFIFIKNIIALNSPHRLIFIASEWIRCCSNFHEIAFAALSAVHKSNCNSTITFKSLQPFSFLYNSPPRCRPSSHPSEAIKIMISTFCLALHVFVPNRMRGGSLIYFLAAPLQPRSLTCLSTQMWHAQLAEEFGVVSFHVSVAVAPSRFPHTFTFDPCSPLFSSLDPLQRNANIHTWL